MVNGDEMGSRIEAYNHVDLEVHIFRFSIKKGEGICKEVRVMFRLF